MRLEKLNFIWGGYLGGRIVFFFAADRLKVGKTMSYKIVLLLSLGMVSLWAPPTLAAPQESSREVFTPGSKLSKNRMCLPMT